MTSMVKKFKTYPAAFFSKEERERIVRAIREAEQETSGEICVYLERKARGDLLAHAKRVFEKIGMTKTEKRNGVLIYLSLRDRAFAILGDKGIHEKVGDGFWQGIVEVLQERFSKNDFAAGLESGIHKIAEKLKTHFPWKPGDKNELPDRIRE